MFKTQEKKNAKIGLDIKNLIFHFFHFFNLIFSNQGNKD